MDSNNNINGDEAGIGINITAKRVSDSQSTITVKMGADILHVDKLDVTKEKQRRDFISKLCEGRKGIDRKEIESYLMQLAADQADPKDAPESTGPSREDFLDKSTPLHREQAREVLNDPKLLKIITDDIGSIGVAGEKELAAMIYLIGTSRLLSKPLAGIVQGPSSSGKSYTIEKVATLFPPEAVLLATQMTPQSLFYMPPGAMAHRFVVAGERSRAEDDETAEATRALREMLSSGKLTKLVPMKTEGKMITQVIEQEGPIAFVESTTLSQIFDEDLNRAILLTTDERQVQTEKIINSIAARFASNGVNSGKQVIDRHHAIQRMIEPLAVLIPFAPLLAQHFPGERVEARRAFPHLLSLIQASALLHQYQRQRDPDGHVLADERDYHLARRLMSGPLSRQLGGGLSDPGKRFYETIKPKAGSGTFTTRDVRKWSTASERSIRGWLAELADLGIAALLQESKGPKPAIWQIVGDIDEAAVSVLPSTEELFPC